MTDQASRESTPPASAVKRGPALVVVGLALTILLAGGGLALAFGRSGLRAGRGATGSAPAQAACAATSPPVRTVAAAGALTPIARGDAIPKDIVAALFVPAGAKLTGIKSLDRLSGQFDREVDLSAPYPRAAIVSCFRSGLRSLGWRLSGGQPARASGGPGSEILAQHPSNDGYYWEVGVTVRGASPTISPALSGAPAAAGTSTVALRLLEVPGAS